MLALNATINQLAMANSECWYSHVLRRENRRILGRVDIDGQRKRWRLKRTWKKWVEEENMKICLSREDVLCQSRNFLH